MPARDSTMTLEDEAGRHFQVKYIAHKTGLSAGWRQFSAAHKLLEGDVLVFQLVGPTKFKVIYWVVTIYVCLMMYIYFLNSEYDHDWDDITVAHISSVLMQDF